MEILKDCSTHELVPITPLAEAIPLNSPLAMDGSGVQAMPMLPMLSHLHLQQQQQQSQMVPIQIQQTQPTIMSSAPSSSSAVVCIGGDPSGLDSEQQLQKLQDVQQSHIIPMVPDSSNSSCLTCLPELPETEDYDEGNACHYGDDEAGASDNRHPAVMMCDGN